MEAAVFLFDCLVMLVVLYMGLLDDRRPSNQPHTSLFRMSPGDGSAEPPRRPSRPNPAEWRR